MPATPLEKLKEDIDALKKRISVLPHCEDRSREALVKANIIKVLAQKEEEYGRTLEEERVAKVVREHEEQHPPWTEKCPICLHDIAITSHESMMRFPCCGSGLQRWAEKDRPWAQYELGNNYWHGDYGCPVDKKKSMEWWERAAKQKHPLALFHLAEAHRNGNDGVVVPSESRAMMVMRMSADRGCTEAQIKTAVIYEDKDWLHYLTLAYGQGGKSAQASCFLGCFFHSKSEYNVAKYYFEEAAAKDYDDVYFLLAQTIYSLHETQYEGMCGLPGHCCIPTVLFWARKAVTSTAEGVTEKEKEDAIAFVGDLERRGKESCAGCGKDAKCLPEQLKQCGRCKAAWYCSKECQKQHWKEGHKVECVKQN